ncbi:hypothetical protein [Burkholderia ubonensis]|uniref:hypothetical protein n=1 Tax=Burkholderia ubonensis TaxID=101571 RepID=UPI000A5EF27D|nr:hypothetical protein [Burkholderia ubonensis]
MPFEFKYAEPKHQSTPGGNADLGQLEYAHRGSAPADAEFKGEELATETIGPMHNGGSSQGNTTLPQPSRNPVAEAGAVVPIRTSRDESASLRHLIPQVASQTEQVDGLPKGKSPRALADEVTIAISKKDALKVAEVIVCKIKGEWRNKGSNSSKPDRIEKMLGRMRENGSSAGFSVRECCDFYKFFRFAQHILDPIERADSWSKNRREVSFKDGYYLCRALKWQFRIGLNAHLKAHLDEQFRQLVEYVEDGGERSNELSIRYAQGVDPVGGIAGYFQIGVSSNLSSTPAQEIKDRTTLEVSVGAEMSLAKWCSANLGVSFGGIHTEKYKTLEEYAKANSGSLAAWAKESKIQTLNNLKDILTIAGHYEKDLLYAGISQPYIQQKLQVLGLTDVVMRATFDPVSRPQEVEFTSKKAIKGEIALDGFGAATVSVEGAVESGVRKKALDAIELMEAYPLLAKDRIPFVPSDVSGASDFVTALRKHVADSSVRATKLILEAGMPGDIRVGMADIWRASREKIEQYVALKMNGKIDSVGDEKIRQIIEENPIILRPSRLKIHTLQTEVGRQVAALDVAVNNKIVAPTAVSVNAQVIKVTKDPDPHVRGRYLELEWLGMFETMDTLKDAINTSLRGGTEPSIDAGAVAAALGGAILHQSHGQFTKAVIKIKEGRPVLMVVQTFSVKADKSGLALPAAPGGEFKVGNAAVYKVLKSESLGSESLDFILPIAIKKLTDRSEMSWWNKYVKSHEPDFIKLIENIGRQDKNSLLSKELVEMRKSAPSIGILLDKLLDHSRVANEAPTSTNRAAAQSALNEFMAEYVDVHYKSEVAKSWSMN